MEWTKAADAGWNGRGFFGALAFDGGEIPIDLRTPPPPLTLSLDNAISAAVAAAAVQVGEITLAGGYVADDYYLTLNAAADVFAIATIGGVRVLSMTSTAQAADTTLVYTITADDDAGGTPPVTVIGTLEILPPVAGDDVYERGTIFVIGGFIGAGASGTNLNDVWATTDPAASWTQIADGVTLAGGIVEGITYNGVMYLMGGGDDDQLVHSANGIDWTQTAAPWSSLHGGGVNVFNNTLMFIGGDNGVTQVDEVWGTIDGQNWTVLSTLPGPGFLFDTVVLDDKLYILGGTGNGAYASFVTGDAINWTTLPAAPDERYVAAAAYNDAIYVIGGSASNANAVEVRRSTDEGVSWATVAVIGAASGDSGEALVHNGTLYYMGGDFDVSNEVWHTTDGINWTQAADAGWSDRFSFAAIVFDGSASIPAPLQLPPRLTLAVDNAIDTAIASVAVKVGDIAVSGGYVAGDYHVTVTSAADNFVIATIGGALVLSMTSTTQAVDTTLVYTITADDDSTETPQAVLTGTLEIALQIAGDDVYNEGTLFIIGGIPLFEDTDVWASSDPQGSWTQVASNVAQLLGRDEAVTYNGTIYVMGGPDDGDKRGAYSSDGINWTPLDPPRANWRNGGVNVFNNTLIFFGGNNSDALGDEVWGTTDGANWNLISTLPAAKDSFDSIVFNNKLYLLGTDGGSEDSYVTGDAINWTVLPNAPPVNRAAAAAYKEGLYMIGGTTLSYEDNVLVQRSVDEGASWQVLATLGSVGSASGEAVVHNGTLYYMGGLHLTDFSNEVWASSNGTDWTRAADADWYGRVFLAAVVLDGGAAIPANLRAPINAAVDNAIDSDSTPPPNPAPTDKQSLEVQRISRSLPPGTSKPQLGFGVAQ